MYSVEQVLFKYERSWSPRAQKNILWRFFKLAYTQITLQYMGALHRESLESSKPVVSSEHIGNTESAYNRSQTSQVLAQGSLGAPERRFCADSQQTVLQGCRSF